MSLHLLKTSCSPPHAYTVCFGGKKYVNTELRLPCLKDSIYCFISLEPTCSSHLKWAVTALCIQHTSHKSREVKCPCLEIAKPLLGAWSMANHCVIQEHLFRNNSQIDFLSGAKETKLNRTKDSLCKIRVYPHIQTNHAPI